MIHQLLSLCLIAVVASVAGTLLGHGGKGKIGGGHQIGIIHGGDHHDEGYGKGKGRSYGGSKYYSFAYGIKDPHYGANFGHAESGSGYNAKGQYYVYLPDGRLQRVTYYTDEHGYHPTVHYEGKAHFPSHGKGLKGGYH